MKPTPERGRWGILGGTFDPVHNGHLWLADEIRIATELDGVLLTPSQKHPLKQNHCQASFAHRLAMLKLVATDHVGFLVSAIEQEMNLSGYTLDTVTALKRQYPHTRFYFIIGADILGELDRWHNLKALLNEVPMLVGTRPSFDLTQFEGDDAGRIEFIPTTPVDISSTDIRARIKGGIDKGLEQMVPPKVREYIRKNGLYT
ncbi:MAG TPA: nicotinate-nucleotide adenylyltransferase [Candidatus Deferrimicrobium sp.]|nr:nicotinate-nucleotide adenylyltransferase [Candidatus Deferrimicrobium sp.]